MASSSSSSSSTRLTDFHRAVFQLLSAHGCLAEDVLLAYLTKLAADFHTPTPIQLSPIFSTMNNYLRKLHFEIKTVMVSTGGAEDEAQRYHGIANTNNDEAAKLYGSFFEPMRLKIFLRILEELVVKKHLSTQELGGFRGEGVNKLAHSQVEDFGRQLCADKWLQRDDRNYYMIGPRSFLELRSVLETVIRDLDGEDEDFKQRLINRLPQLIIY